MVSGLTPEVVKFATLAYQYTPAKLQYVSLVWGEVTKNLCQYKFMSISLIGHSVCHCCCASVVKLPAVWERGQKP